MRSSENYLVAISQEIPQPPVTKLSLKMTHLNFHSNLVGANGLQRISVTITLSRNFRKHTHTYIFSCFFTILHVRGPPVDYIFVSFLVMLLKGSISHKQMGGLLHTPNAYTIELLLGNYYMHGLRKKFCKLLL